MTITQEGVMDDKSQRKIYEEKRGLWYDVVWDDQIKCFVWTVAPYQKIVLDC
ncbi:hypothetical protein KKA15_05560 [Patescibacteria group bacterium]|nr:hypothetical protein [Patescibacteria group bacterium]